jgi:hypothetical protein
MAVRGRLIWSQASIVGLTGFDREAFPGIFVFPGPNPDDLPSFRIPDDRIYGHTNKPRLR